MKTFNVLFVLFALVLAGGCTKEDPATLSQANEEPAIYKLELTAEGFQIREAISYEEIMSRTSGTVESRSNPNAMANGDFNFINPLDGREYGVKGHAMQNNSGAHGAVEQVSYLTGNTWKGDAHCVTTWGEDDNRAVTGWEITENNDFFGCNGCFLGWVIYTATEDNGQGANAPSDRVSLAYYLANPAGGFYTPTNQWMPYNASCEFFANSNWFPEAFWVDITEGWIQVQ